MHIFKCRVIQCNFFLNYEFESLMGDGEKVQEGKKIRQVKYSQV